MNLTRYLTFEISQTCDLAYRHDWCPINHPERYMFGQRTRLLTDEIILDFYKWAKFTHGFRGIILWHMYNEPTHHLARIRRLMTDMKRIDKHQPFQLTTNSRPDIEGFDIVHFTDYDDPNTGHDDRILVARGEGKPYAQFRMRQNRCKRGHEWEVPIDNFGNWCLCCNDWRCEQAVGNIFSDDWEEMYTRFIEKSKSIRWSDERTYNNLPRLCRACLDITPNLHRTGSVF